MKNYIFGKNTIANALAHNESILEIYFAPSFKDDRISSLLKKSKIKSYMKSIREIEEMVGKVNHQGIVACIEEYKYVPLEDMLKKVEGKKDALFVMLDGIEDPHNLGAILRSVDAFGADGVIIGANRAAKLNGTVAKVSTGAIEYVDVAMVTNLTQTINKLKEEGFWVVSSDGSATSDYREIDYNMRTLLVIGSEGFGISKLVLKNSDFVTKIPMVGHVNSLNASVACALYLAEIYASRNPIK